MPRKDIEDSWYWIFVENGEFTVKSCYSQLLGERRLTNASFWMKFWSLKLPSKIVHFVWRACRSCLPTAFDLKRKHVNINAGCPWCHNYEENGIHVVFDEMFAISFWVAVGPSSLIQYIPNDNVFDGFVRIFEHCTRD